MAAGIAVEALERAWRRGYVAGSAVLRPDRGSQRTPRLPACRADGREARLSVGRAGSRHGNAVAESFLATLGNSMHSLREWRAREGARDAAIRFIERRCNRHRPRPTIGSRVPGEAMDALFEGAKPAEAAVGQRAREGRTAAW